MKLLILISIIFNIILFAQNEVKNSFSYIQLENKSYTLQEIVQKSEKGLFVPLHQKRSVFGFTNDIFWIKVISKNSGLKEKTQILEMGYPTLDIIDIYELQDTQLLLKKELGDWRVQDEKYLMPNPTYEFVVPAKETKILFIRVLSTGSVQLGITVQSFKSYIRHSSVEVKWLSFYFGAVFIMLMYNFILYLIIKNKSFLYYVLFHISYTAFALSLSGIAAQILWPNIPELNKYAIPVSMSLSGTFAFLFAIYFLDLKQLSRRLYNVIYAFVPLSVVIAFMPFVTGYRTAVVTSSAISFIAVVLLSATSFYLAFFKKNINAFFYLIAWSFFQAGVGIAHLVNIGWFPATQLTHFASQIGSFFELLLLSIGLAFYYNRLKDEHSKLRNTNNQLRALSNTDMLTGSYNRRYFYDNAKRLLEDAKAQERDLYLLMLDLDHFKDVNDTYGHDIGDKVLISFAHTCQKILRNDDMFVRYGGEEFVILLATAEKETAINIAKRINKEVRETSFNVASELRVTVSIGIAHTSYEIEALLSSADKALYSAKESGRDTYVFFDKNIS